MPKRTWTELDLITAVKESTSLAQVLVKLNLSSVGTGNRKTISTYISKLSLDISHFTGKGHLKGKTHNWCSTKIPLSDILVEHSSYQTFKLKNRLIKEQLLVNQCSICNQLPEWNGTSLNMILDHINGVNDDHRLVNLRLVCPNCNSQLDTFAGKNKGKV